ncbi:Protein of unknown function [Peptoniphilus asaccharolyticus DSM 20463]|uniref:DUF669 domain-containing protein n=1 Tax=Peptoniphilus asaccharolyticus DSM 20463 TaxID=573058 RepID=A0A1W1UZE8_PEPAS|nr:DUF669 domain-containing protein [Peptoniphilus asaccharolyticus]MBL7575397.1 DUF669 domain-containing protein [Peptoniphilus asaccharolyticus]SMB86475.1 Protein of unknown function [Peptoniphilus asaccharolyticus DSM 20463]
MSNIWEKFDKEIDKDIQKQIEDAENSEYAEVPLGDYEVKVDNMELKISKSGNPMVSIWFRIIAGDYNNNLLFMNQVINQPFQIGLANKILRALYPNKNIEFETYSQYANLIMDIYEEIDGKFEYAIRYGEKKGFSTFEVLDIFEV